MKRRRNIEVLKPACINILSKTCGKFLYRKIPGKIVIIRTKFLVPLFAQYFYLINRLMTIISNTVNRIDASVSRQIATD